MDWLATSPAPRFPRARRRDAASSHTAAADIERSGAGNQQALDVLAALRRYPGSTSAELAAVMRVPRQMPARRLPELESIGRVRDSGRTEDGARKVSETKCSATGRRCVRWWVVE